MVEELSGARQSTKAKLSATLGMCTVEEGAKLVPRLGLRRFLRHYTDSMRAFSALGYKYVVSSLYTYVVRLHHHFDRG